MAPASGASGTFPTGDHSTTITTDDGGMATAPEFTANGSWHYEVSAIKTGSIPARFFLTNIAWYVAPTGSDGNTCTSSATACATINVHGNQGFRQGDTSICSWDIRWQGDEVVRFDKMQPFLGVGCFFSTQNGTSIIDSQNSRRGSRSYHRYRNVGKNPAQNGVNPLKTCIGGICNRAI